jgi:hypothetical protein
MLLNKSTLIVMCLSRIHIKIMILHTIISVQIAKDECFNGFKSCKEKALTSDTNLLNRGETFFA